ncbi:MAG: SRPBCC family protein [Streptosporangiaceae bacterium]
MTGRSVIHDTFSIERIYPATPSMVFGAFASEEAKTRWGDTGGIETPAGAEPAEFDFRPGGRERFTVSADGTIYRYDALYYDIVPDQRIVYSYEMYADGSRISVSVATIEFAASGAGTVLTWTEQGAYLDGIDGPQASALREEGTAEMLDGLGRYLAAQTES